MGRLERAAVQQRLTDESEAVTERISAAIRDQIPAYASLGDAQRRETEAIVTWGVRRLLDLWVDRARRSTRPIFDGSTASERRAAPTDVRCSRCSGPTASQVSRRAT